PADVGDAGDDRDALDAAPLQLTVVVEEADDAHCARLAQLAEQAAPAAPGADDEDPLLLVAVDQRAQRVADRALPEPRDADQERADEDVDRVDAAREPVPRDGRPDEE